MPAIEVHSTSALARTKTKSTPAAPATPNGKKPAPSRPANRATCRGLPGTEDVENESVAELIEEGQFSAPSVADAVANAPSAEEGPVRVRRRPEDDLPPEYAGRAPDDPKE